MITKVVIKDNRKSPLSYLSELGNFRNGREFEFKPGINIVVGENGSGKSTLLKLIGMYNLVGKQMTEFVNVRELGALSFSADDGILDGVDVYGDYRYVTFRLAHKGELMQGEECEEWMKNIDNFTISYNQMHASTGEGVKLALNLMFRLMFSADTDIKFPYERLEGLGESVHADKYLEYIKEHRVECENEVTLLLDEPDRNLDIENVREVRNIITYRKENTQTIVVVHNPLIIVSLANMRDRLNIIEMTPGYVDKVVGEVKSIIEWE